MIHQHVNPMVCYPQEPIHFVLGISKARAKSKNSTCFFLFGPCTVISCSFHAFCTQTKHLAAKPVPLREGQSWGGFSVAIQLHDFVLSLDVFEFLWSMVTELLIVANVWVPTVGSAFISRSCKMRENFIGVFRKFLIYSRFPLPALFGKDLDFGFL